MSFIVSSDLPWRKPAGPFFHNVGAAP